MADAGLLGTLSFRDLPALPSLEFVTIENKAKEMMTCRNGGSNRETVGWGGGGFQKNAGHVAGDVAGPGRISKMGRPSL